MVNNFLPNSPVYLMYTQYDPRWGQRISSIVYTANDFWWNRSSFIGTDFINIVSILYLGGP